MHSPHSTYSSSRTSITKDTFPTVVRHSGENSSSGGSSRAVLFLLPRSMATPYPSSSSLYRRSSCFKHNNIRIAIRLGMFPIRKLEAADHNQTLRKYIHGVIQGTTLRSSGHSSSWQRSPLDSKRCMGQGSACSKVCSRAYSKAGSKVCTKAFSKVCAGQDPHIRWSRASGRC